MKDSKTSTPEWIYASDSVSPYAEPRNRSSPDNPYHCVLDYSSARSVEGFKVSVHNLAKNLLRAEPNLAQTVGRDIPRDFLIPRSQIFFSCAKKTGFLQEMQVGLSDLIADYTPAFSHS